MPIKSVCLYFVGFKSVAQLGDDAWQLLQNTAVPLAALPSWSLEIGNQQVYCIRIDICYYYYIVSHLMCYCYRIRTCKSVIKVCLKCEVAKWVAMIRLYIIVVLCSVVKKNVLKETHWCLQRAYFLVKLSTEVGLTGKINNWHLVMTATLYRYGGYCWHY